MHKKNNQQDTTSSIIAEQRIQKAQERGKRGQTREQEGLPDTTTVGVTEGQGRGGEGALKQYNLLLIWE
jgi:hypothetical protein